MDFDAVKTKTVFTGFDAAEQAKIVAAMKTAYDGSAIAKKMFDDWIAAGKSIFIDELAGKFQVLTANNHLQLDIDWLDDNLYIDKNGNAVADTLVSGLVHELGHALKGLPDNRFADKYKGDLLGDNQTFINTIYKELAIAEQVSYTAYDASGSQIVAGYKYTQGVAIDLAANYIKDQNFNTMQPADAANSDLIIGTSSANIIVTGAGNDFLVGNGGNDTLKGGKGEDTAIYMGDKLDYDVRHNADGSWTVKHVRGTKTDGTDRLENVEKIRFKGEEIFELKAKGLTYESDFAIVVDTTGSMGSSIGTVKTKINALLDSAFDDGKADARIGVVGFKDVTNGEPTSILLGFTDQDSFADRKAAALTAISNITVSGGGDTPETSFDGLLKALDGTMGKWRAGAGIHRVVLFTDAPAKDGALAAQVAALANSIGATVSSSSSKIMSDGRVDTFELAGGTSERHPADGTGPDFVDVDEPIDPLVGVAGIEVYTIHVGSVSLPDLDSFAEDTGGAVLKSSSTETVGDLLIEIFGSKLDFEGTPDDDIIKGNANDNVINALAGDDTITASLGNDTIDAGAGNDHVEPGLGLDVITLGTGDDTLKGTLVELNGDIVKDFAFGDKIIVEAETLTNEKLSIIRTDTYTEISIDTDDDGTADSVLKLEGDFAIYDFEIDNSSFSADSTIVMKYKDLTLTGDGNDNDLSGYGGQDLILNGLGNNTLRGEAGSDKIFAFSGVNTIDGGDDNDFLNGGFQADKLNGGGGNDLIRGDGEDGFIGGSDIINGGKGDDILMGGKNADQFVFTINDGADTIAAFKADKVTFDTTNGYQLSVNAKSKDFVTGQDQIALDSFVSVTTANVMDFVADGTVGAVFSAEGTDITFFGVNANELSATDFMLL